jgi:hypothetical protein
VRVLRTPGEGRRITAASRTAASVQKRFTGGISDDRGGYDSDVASLPAAGPTALTWAHSFGSVLFNLDDATEPVFLKAGIYAVMVSVNPHNPVSGVELPDGASFSTRLAVNDSPDPGGVAIDETFQVGTDQDAGTALTVVWFAAAGSSVSVIVNNRDASARHFSAGMRIQRITDS